jgi:hypothetical protein
MMTLTSNFGRAPKRDAPARVPLRKHAMRQPGQGQRDGALDDQDELDRGVQQNTPTTPNNVENTLIFSSSSERPRHREGGGYVVLNRVA